MTADAVPPPRLSPAGGSRERNALSGCRAGFVTRSLANALDLCLVLIALILGWLAVAALRFLAQSDTFHFPGLGTGLLLVLGEVLLAAYFAASWSLTGRTYGDAVLGLRAVDAHGQRIAWPLAVVRAVLCVVFPVGLLWVLVSPVNRSLQDAVLRTSVVYDWTDAPAPAARAVDPVHPASS